MVAARVEIVNNLNNFLFYFEANNFLPFMNVKNTVLKSKRIWKTEIVWWERFSQLSYNACDAVLAEIFFLHFFYGTFYIFMYEVEEERFIERERV